MLTAKAVVLGRPGMGGVVHPEVARARSVSLPASVVPVARAHQAPEPNVYWLEVGVMIESSDFRYF